MDIKNWKIKDKFLKDGVPNLLLTAMHGDLTIFSNFNQSIGAISESCSSNHIESLFQVYTTFGIYLAKNNMVELNFKEKGIIDKDKLGYLG